MEEYSIIKICNYPQYIDNAAKWFSDKWNNPVQIYIDSMNESLKHSKIPQWYLVLYRNEIIAGAGVIDNDFHKRVDLTPNICAVYVEKEHRKKGIARKLLNYICDDMKNNKIEVIYLITTHTDFYERCGWEFFGLVEENDGNMIRMYKYDLR